MNSLTIKIIALITMMIDHYGAIFHSDISLYRIIGRLAFPIYCFLLVEGFTHTKNVKKYGERLFIFALISEPPFDLAFYGALGIQHQNIFFTLFIGLVAMYFMEKYGTSLKGLIILYLGGILATFLAVDYSFVGIIYIMSFYFTRNLPKERRLPLVALILFISNLLTMGFLQHYALLALPIMYFYNGEPGPKHKSIQLLFYALYPLHLLVYYFIKMGYLFTFQ